jgi:2-polyprenyl-6-methoxyphenol hydroxylase-like FAD-dependent oxidoreductase
MGALDVGIVGAGTAGSAAALFLARAGHRVTIYERVERPGPVGAGILLQPTGQAVLARLGLLGPVLDRGARVERLRCRTARGRELFHLRYADVDASLHGVGLHRGTLFETLFGAVRTEPGITLRLGVSMRALGTTEGGRFLVDAEGTRHGPHELVVVADGAGSQLRDDEPIPQRASVYPWGAVWHVARDPERTFRDELFQVVEGAEVMLGFLPTGLGPGDDTPVVSLFWSLRRAGLEAFRAAPIARWKARVLGYEPRAAPLLDDVREPGALLFATYRDVVLARPDGDRVVFLGDAAHAMSPQLGQGANLALFDAMVLADALAADDALAEGLARYGHERAAHVRFYQRASRWLTPFFQGDSRLLALARDVGFPLAASIPLLRDPMIRSMAGIKRGVLRPSLPLATLARLSSGAPALTSLRAP